jgi:HPt (histidine-containing phosphotransfer) domain-containing protein
MVDIARIEELNAEVGEDAVARILSVFVSEAAGTIGRIDGDLDDAAFAAAIHFLRSGALNLGFTSLAAAAGTAASARQGERAQAAGELRSILRRSAKLLGLADAVPPP